MNSTVLNKVRKNTFTTSTLSEVAKKLKVHPMKVYHAALRSGVRMVWGKQCSIPTSAIALVKAEMKVKPKYSLW